MPDIEDNGGNDMSDLASTDLAAPSADPKTPANASTPSANDNPLPTFDEAAAQHKEAQSKLPSWSDVVNRTNPDNYSIAGAFLNSRALAHNPFTAEGQEAFNEGQQIWMRKQPFWNIVKAFGHGYGQQYSAEMEDTMSTMKSSLVEDFKKGDAPIVQSFMDNAVIPVAKTLWTTYVSAPFAGAQEAAYEGGKEFVSEKFGRDIAAMPEAFAGEVPVLPPHVAEAKANGALEDDATFFGLKEPTPEQSADIKAATNQLPPEPQEPPVVDNSAKIHSAAREIAPETFEKYDALSSQKDDLRSQLQNLADERDKKFPDFEKTPEQVRDEQSVIQTHIDTLSSKKRLTASDTAKLNDLQTQYQDLSEQHDYASGRDTPEMSAIRQKIQQTDYSMRDLAPDVSSAYRDAETKVANAPPEAAPEPPASAPEAAPPSPEVEGHKAAITQDVSQKLVTAGRPKDEADAAAQLVAEHYQARSERFGGKLGTAKEMYERDAPTIEKGRDVARKKVLSQELSQKARGKFIIGDERNTVRLFKSADASTFIHETGHAWLDELMNDAEHELASEDLKNDAAAVRKWLGDDEGEFSGFTGRQHEKFARGFERYMMEGTAPSRALDKIFAQFKDWLSKIYQTVDRLKSPINDDIRDVFDRLLSKNPEKAVIAPEAEAAEVAPASAPEGVPPEGPAAPTSASPPAATSEATPAPTSELPPAKPTATPSAPTPEEPTEEAAGTSTPFKKTDNGLVDKAGNIRLDKLNTPEDLNRILKDAADRNGAFEQERRVGLTASETLDLADAMGVDGAWLAKKKVGDVYGPEEIIAIKKALIQSAAAVKQAMADAQAAGKTRESMVALAETIARHDMIQGKLAQSTAEWAHTGQALQIVLEGAKDTADLSTFLKQTTGRTLNQLEKMVDSMDGLDTPQKVNKFIEDSKKPTFGDKVIFYRVNSLISGPITHFRYAVGNALNAIYEPLVQTPFAATVGAIRTALNGEAAVDRVYYREMTAQLYGLGKGSVDGLRAAVQAWKDNVSPALPSEKLNEQVVQGKNPIGGPLGAVIGVPGRGVNAIHSFFKTLRYEQNIQKLAVRNALNAGLTGGELENEISRLTMNPTPEMMSQATADALHQVYMTPTDYETFTGRLQAATNKSVIAKSIAPFMKIGTEIETQALVEGSPLGLLSKRVWDKVLAGGATSDTAVSKIAAGTAVMGGGFLMASQGILTGDGPNDPAQRRIWLLNHSPNSIQIGDITLPYKGLGYVGMQLRFAANTYEAAKYAPPHDMEKLAVDFFEGFTKSILDDNWMYGVKNALDAVYHPEEYGASFIKDFATSWLPYSVGIGQVAHEIDPYRRETRSIWDEAQSKIPFASEGLHPERDTFGQPVTQGANIDKYGNDPVVQRLQNLQIGIGKLDRKILGVPLTDAQYDNFSRVAGTMTKMRLNNLVTRPGFAQLPLGKQIDMIRQTVESSRTVARSIIKMQNPNIPAQAVANKRSFLVQGKH